ncbi:MAG: bacterial Ig-like domain-containing protein, partial [Clostridia bacterium]|nr:bacterial Ig-like domain-containing protein [Clostridia bacterium]
MKTLKKALSIVLCAAMLLGLFSFAAWAEDWNEIYTVDDLYNVRYDLAANYKLMNDIDLTDDTAEGGDYDFMGNGWNPIGSNNVYGNGEFSGIFDGCGFSITGLRIDVTSYPSGTGNIVFLGVFAKVTGTVKNLTVDGNISSNINKEIHLGSVCADMSGTVSNCASKCSITVSQRAYYYWIGGIVGEMYGDQSKIEKCFNAGNITVANGYQPYYSRFSGICGMVSSYQATIENCCNLGNISGFSYYDNTCSGIVGLYQKNFTLTNCYNVGTVSGGGNYAISAQSCTNCYYLAGTGSDSTGATSLSEALMRKQASFVGFDFTNTWIMYPDSLYKYPQLRSNPIDDANAVTSMSVSTLPNKTTYEIGESFNPSGGKLTVNYSDSTSITVTLNRDMVTGFDSSVPGIQVLTVTYGRNTTTFNVEVLSGADPFNASAAIAASISNLEPGDEVTLTVSLTDAPDANTLNLAFDYDVTDVFTLVSGEWLLTGAASSSFDSLSNPCGAASIGFSSATDINGDVFRLKLRVKADAAFGAKTVAVTPTLGVSSTTVACPAASASLRVTCEHSSKTLVPEQASTYTVRGWDAYYICDGCGLLFASDGVTELDGIPYRPLEAVPQAALTIAADSAQPVQGDEVVFTVSLSGAIDAGTLSLDFDYDTDVFTLINGAWLLSGASSSSFGADLASVAYASATDLNGDVFALTLKVKNAAALGAATVTVTPAIADGVLSVPCDPAAATVSVQRFVYTEEVGNYKPSSDASAWTAPTEDGRKFAGWYTDDSFTEA